MFVYLSFLRPPPLHAKPDSQVSFCVQIANDLRTELWQSPLDIYYYWSSSLGRTRNAKLFTWKPDAAYKVLSVNPPPIAQNNRTWTLCLNTRTPVSAEASVELEELNAPLPVHSIPIQFELSWSKSDSGKWDKKSVEIERIYKFADNSSLVIRESTSFELDKKIWDSGLGLSSWLSKMLLARMPMSPAIQELDKVLRGNELSVIELGAGTGMVSLVLASLLQKITPHDKRTLWATDLGSALEIMSHNFSVNAKIYHEIDLRAAELDWEEAIPDAILQHVQGNSRNFDVIILADVTYNQAYFGALSSTLVKLMSPHTLVLFAYKERDPAERDFWDILKTLGITLEPIEKLPGVGGAPVEIWLGRKDERLTVGVVT